MPCLGSKKKQKPPPATIRGLKLVDDDDVEASRRSNSDQPDVNPPPRRRKKRGGRRKGASSSTQIQTPADQPEEEAALTVMDPKLARFGPTYGDDIEANRTLKDLTWNHIIKTDKSSDSYLSSIEKIELPARQSYDPSVGHSLRPASQFRQRMAIDGCFFLQLALHVLGAGKLLGYPDKHPYFGADKDTSYWIPAMFFVGNQIPYVVIRALMKQAFFQKVINEGIQKGTWRQPPKELPKLVLYLTVVEPELKRPALIALLLSKIMFRQPPPRLREPPSDILHALHSLFLGPGNDPVYSEIKEFRDLEAGRDDDKIRFPSAGELLKSGIRLKKAKKGITSIHFHDLIYRAYLYVPPLTIDSYTENMLRSLVSYEQNLNESDREVTAYLRFIKDLVQTYKDFKILERKGIIKVEKDELKYTMVQMLNKFVASQKCSYTLNFRQIRSKITDYEGPPWRLISFLLGVLTVVQTIFTILSYFWPPT